MTDPGADEDRRREARAYVKKLRGFYIHLSVFGLVAFLLMAINLVTYSRFLWFLFPVLEQTAIRWTHLIA